MDNHWDQVTMGIGWDTDKVFCLATFRNHMAGKPVTSSSMYVLPFAVHRYLEMPCKCAECVKITETVGNWLRTCYKEG